MEIDRTDELHASFTNTNIQVYMYFISEVDQLTPINSVKVVTFMLNPI